jgi:Protein of unknown function (DUF3618)
MARPDTKGGAGRAGADNPSTQEIQADIEHTRKELGETIEALTAKLDVKQRAREKVGETRDAAVARLHVAKGQALDLTDRAKAGATDDEGRPTTTAMAGAGTALVVLVTVAVLVIWRRRR